MSKIPTTEAIMMIFLFFIFKSKYLIMSAKVVIFHLMIVLYIKISAFYFHKMRILKNKKSHLEDAAFRMSGNRPVLLAQKAQ